MGDLGYFLNTALLIVGLVPTSTINSMVVKVYDELGQRERLEGLPTSTAEANLSNLVTLTTDIGVNSTTTTTPTEPVWNHVSGTSNLMTTSMHLSNSSYNNSWSMSTASPHLSSQKGTVAPSTVSPTLSSNSSGEENGTAICEIYNMSVPSMKAEECEHIRRVIIYIHCAFNPVLGVLGAFGNTISLLVMTRPNMRKFSTAWYSSALAVTDTILLWNQLPHWYYLWTGADRGGDLSLHHFVQGKLFHFFFFVCSYVSVYLCVGMAIDRFIVIYFPLKAKTWCSVKRARWSIAIIYGTFILLFGYYLVFMTGADVYIYGVVPLFDNKAVSVWFNTRQIFVEMVVYCLVPVLVLVVTNTLSIRRLVQMGQLGLRKTAGGQGGGPGGGDCPAPAAPEQQQAGTSSTGSANRGRLGQVGTMSKTQVHFTIMAILVCGVLLILTIPILMTTMVYMMFAETMTKEEFVYLTLAQGITVCLPYVNSSVNCIIYCVAGQKFRRELRDMCNSVCRRKQQEDVSPNNS